MSKKITLAFFGSSENSLLVLKTLIDDKYDIGLVVTAPPRPTGRKKILTKTPIHKFAQEKNIPIIIPEILSPLKVRPLKVDVAIVADYARIIPKKLLKIPKHGFLNLHPSLLPKYRGSTPAEAAILSGDKETGVSIIKMNEMLDQGPIISWFKEKIIEPVYSEEIRGDSKDTLYKRLFESGSEVLTTILPSWIEGKIIPREQNNSHASYAYRLTRNHGFIPWKTFKKAIKGEQIIAKDIPELLRKYLKNIKYNLQTTDYKLLERAIRAFHPWPGVWTLISTKSGEKRLKIISSKIKDDKLALLNAQLEGKKPQSYQEINSDILDN